SINITARNLEEPDLTERVERTLRRHDLLPDRVEFEFTEGALLHNSNRSMQQLRDLRALGLRIAVDDFGTGYCNFSYLRQLPASVVKLD
ncbi:EAL domain-containing protein, partial [Acinetobacter baumannii]